MSKIVLAVCTLWLSALGCLAQAKIIRSAETTLPDSARFQIINPEKEGVTTPLFRLDRYSGQVFRLSSCAKDAKLGSEKCWREMTVVDLPNAGPVVHPRFQIYVGGTPQMILLMQVDSGATWQYGVADPDKWYPFIETVLLP